MTQSYVGRVTNIWLIAVFPDGSTRGTVDDPKFAVKDMFAVYILPELIGLVGPGREYEGYTDIIQGDKNAGPQHGESAYTKFVTE
jgi:hypothetical protein